MTNKIQTLVGDTQLTDLNTAELQPLTGLDPKQSDKRVAIKYPYLVFKRGCGICSKFY